jgi:hypothetical protein
MKKKVTVTAGKKDKEQKQVIAAPVETLAQKRERIENELRNKPRVRLDIVQAFGSTIASPTSGQDIAN